MKEQEGGFEGLILVAAFIGVATFLIILLLGGVIEPPTIDFRGGVVKFIQSLIF